jgi:hypothetical protein
VHCRATQEQSVVPGSHVVCHRETDKLAFYPHHFPTPFPVVRLIYSPMQGVLLVPAEATLKEELIDPQIVQAKACLIRESK